MKDNLNKVEMLNRVEKMLIAADDLKVGSDILSGRLVTSMIGQGLLDVLELEILLKATLLAEQGQPKNFAHNYRKIWRAVTDQTKSFVVAEASQRYSGHANLEDVFSILADLEDVFVNDRYSYELSGDWELRFHPIERLGLCFGLRNWLKNWILKEKSIKA